jgi:hypothetical protein
LHRYASLTETDHFVQPTLEHDYRVALTYTCEEIRVQLWKNLFAVGLPSLYKLAASLAYLFSANSAAAARGASAIVGVTLGTLVFSLLWYATRINKGGEVWRTCYHLNRESEHLVAILLRSWSLTREAQTAEADSRAAYDGCARRVPASFSPTTATLLRSPSTAALATCASSLKLAASRRSRTNASLWLAASFRSKCSPLAQKKCTRPLTSSASPMAQIGSAFVKATTSCGAHA